MGLRFELIWLDYFRFTSFYTLLPLELGCSYAVVWHLYGLIKPTLKPFHTFELFEQNIVIDYSVVIMLYVLISIPRKYAFR